MARLDRQPRDNRPEVAIELAERALRLPGTEPDPATTDPLLAQQAALERMLHPNLGQWPGNLRQFLHSSLRPWNRDIPIEAPDITTLRPLIWKTVNGMVDEPWDSSPAWRAYFGTDDNGMQGRLRTLFHNIHGLGFPAIDDKLVNAIGEFVIAIFDHAAAEQKARLAKSKHAPARRAQAGAALLERLPEFREAFLGWAEASRDLAGVPFAGMARDLVDLRVRLERELSQ